MQLHEIHMHDFIPTSLNVMANDKVSDLAYIYWYIFDLKDDLDLYISLLNMLHKIHAKYQVSISTDSNIMFNFKDR